VAGNGECLPRDRSLARDVVGDPCEQLVEPAQVVAAEPGGKSLVERDHGAELDDLANQAADDALLAVMSRLERFERRSRFTTWAYKFAIHTAGVAVRRHAWRNRELATHPNESLEQLSSLADDPAEAAQTRELLARIAAAIARLTAHQRGVLLALTVDGVPIDVLADRLSTNRNALYKTLHDARTRLRSLLEHEETR
jgi:RNA polymerase sigma-70 factor (ECF subfamily)